ncbi:hypothetical protein [Streptomyces sp. NPDC086787]|uniref:hypothetical protein n=1 Tax=Streptomyces sp. NPDC086787 TaxID=3365759 RepID=UPI00380ABC1B
MTHGTVLTRKARVVGGLICAVLAVIELGWMIRDMDHVGPHDTVWTWFGAMLPGFYHAPLATSQSDVVLLAVYAGACVVSTRSAGSGALVTAAVFTLALRTPTVWIFSSDWTEGLPDRTRLLLTGITQVVAAVALIVTVIVSRRPADNPALGTPPARPRRVPAAVAGALLALYGLIGVAWQFYLMGKYTSKSAGPRSYEQLFTGEYTIGSLLGAPPAWNGWAIVALCLLTAAQAFVRTPVARMSGPALGLTLSVSGAATLIFYHTAHMPFTLDAPTSEVLQRLTLVLEIAVGIAALSLFALRDRGRTPTSTPPDWQPPAPAYGDWKSPGA